MFVNVKIVGLLGILAIAISAHPILEGFGNVAVPLISHQNHTTSVQEIVRDNKVITKSTVEQASKSIPDIKPINDLLIYDVQNDEGVISKVIIPLGTAEGVEPLSGKPGDENPESGKPGDKNPESGKPDADNPASGKPVAESVKPGTNNNKPASVKPIRQEETPTTTIASPPPIETTTAPPGNSTENNGSSDPIRASIAVFFPMLLVLIKYI